jgi:flagellar biosynthesis protein FlhB
MSTELIVSIIALIIPLSGGLIYLSRHNMKSFNIIIQCIFALNVYVCSLFFAYDIAIAFYVKHFIENHVPEIDMQKYLLKGLESYLIPVITILVMFFLITLLLALLLWIAQQLQPNGTKPKSKVPYQGIYKSRMD